MAKILDGKIASSQIENELIKEIDLLKIKPKLKIIQVGDDAPSNKYVSLKMKKAAKLGVIASLEKIQDTSLTTEDLIRIINDSAKECNGIIVQLPLPTHIDKRRILAQLPVDKDIDGLNPNNKFVRPATPEGIITLLKRYEIKLKGKICGVIGQSDLVGGPLSNMLEEEGASVIRMDKSTGIERSVEAEILIVAAGHANLISKENIKENVIIVDVGINEIGDKTAMTKIVGDVNKESVFAKASWLSPVPGGVGPMTIISIFQNLLKLYKIQEKHGYK